MLATNQMGPNMAPWASKPKVHAMLHNPFKFLLLDAKFARRRKRERGHLKKGTEKYVATRNFYIFNLRISLGMFLVIKNEFELGILHGDAGTIDWNR